MLERECVPERDRVPCLQCYGYPLEQEHGLLLLVGYLSDSSSHFGDKLDCFLVPRSSGFNCNWCKLVGLCQFSVLLSAARFARFAAADAVVAVSACTSWRMCQGR